MEEKLSYYVVIPMPIFKDDNLSKTEKLLYGLISALANKEGYCFASNEYLASEMNIKDPTTISKLLKNLEKKGYIKIVLIKKGAIVKHRKIYINNEWLKCQPTVGQNAVSTVGENAKDNNITIKGISNYIKEINKEIFFENEDLNEKYKEYLKMRYEKKCKATKTTIASQIKMLSNYSIEQAIKIIQYSIENGYQGLFKPKEDKPYQQETKVPDWYEKNIEEETLSADEEAKMKAMLSEFK